MNVFCILLGILAIIAGIVIPIISNTLEENRRTRRSYGSYDTSDEEPKTTMTKKTGRGVWITITILGMLLLILGNSFEIIPTGYTGVRTTFGQISANTVPQGFVWKIPFAQEIHTVNNKQQDTKFTSEVWGETNNKTPVYASDIIIKYQIDPSRSAWIYTNVSNTSNLISQEIVASATKSAMVELDVNEVTNRAKIEPLVKEKLAASINETYGENTISILKVTINQMDFEENYNAAIQQKSLASQEQERQRIENETAIEKAEADKKVSIANAEAQAESKRIAAEADAEATRIAADAEAEANTKIRDSLSDAVLRAKFYETWNGELPDAMGADTIITDITGDNP